MKRKRTTRNNKLEFSPMNATIFVKKLMKKYKLYLCQLSLVYYQYHESEGIYKAITRNTLESFIMKEAQLIHPCSWELKWHNNVAKAMELLVPKVEKFDIHKNLLCLNNGVLNLETFEFTNFSKKYLQTIKVPVDYDPQAKCPKFHKFLSEIFEGKDTKTWRMTAFEMLGYCLTAETKSDKFFLLLGSGANGKSTFIKVLMRLCGEQNYSTVSIEGLNRSFERYNLVGKTLNIISEADITKGSLNSPYLKALVTGDPISAEIKFGASFSFLPMCKIVIAANAMPPPEIDRTIGFSRRFFVIPFSKQFLGRDANLNLLDELVEELPGILRYSILGLQRLRKEQYCFSGDELSKKFVEDYVNASSPIYEFTKDCIIPKPNNRIDNSRIFTAYLQWCGNVGENCNMSQRQFTIAFKSALRAKNVPFQDKRSNGERQLQGIALKKNLDDEILL